ncbi:GNAT family N-acetyltransferase [Paenibacillus sp. FSL R7-0331]|uniref:GNAT family N-acetyltransferase n=1 Tax=Paenibacillus sp. FSL R7-0331 TaxID=1536773 RepID=UPI0004F78E80|nr:GNAT family protein [Paenibacillus sp. FSL R7-0331]AIQ50532.1 hypothetical protein R70331_02580 [Paenibacillus sp. FSL R7-0331]
MYKSAGIIPTLYGARVSLRPLSAAHAAVLYEIWTHPAVGLWLDAPPLASAAEAEQLIELLLQMSREEESLRWSIVLPGGEIIGSCGFNQWQLAGAYRGELGCELSPSCWGQGYMREALALLLEFGFVTMGLNRIEALCHPDNLRAAGLFRALGFSEEGIMRQYRHTASGFQDTALFALLRSDRI